MPKWTSAALLTCALAGCGGGGGYGGGGGNSGGNGGGGGPTYTIGGTVSGLDGTVVLQNNGSDDLFVNHAGGTGAGTATFTFATPVANRGAYAVTVKTHPLNQSCTVSGGGAGNAAANVTNVAIDCSALPTVDLQAVAGAHSATLSWDITGIANTPLTVSRYNVIVEPKCPAGSQCPNPQLLLDVHSPLTVAQLNNGQAYLFTVETLFTNGAHGHSNIAGVRPNVLAFDGTVNAIATAADGTVYVGGRFGKVGTVTGGAVPLDATTGRPSAVDFPIVGGRIRATVSDRAGGWYIGGDFAGVADLPQRNLVHILADGTVDAAFHPDPDSIVESIAVAPAGDVVYIGGDFTRIGVTERHHLAALRANGDLLDWNPDANAEVFALEVAGTVVYAGGTFTLVGNQQRLRLAAIDTAGMPLPWNPRANSDVKALAIADDIVYVGGEFSQIQTAAGNAVRNFVAAIRANGELTPWDPNADDSVRAIAIAGNSVYLGGRFSGFTVQGTSVSRVRLAAFSKAGELLPWDPRGGDTVSALAIAGETIYAGGRFESVGGETRHRLAAIRADGQLVVDWHPSVDGDVTALAISGNTVYVGGNFRSTEGAIRRNLAALTANGELVDWHPDVSGTVEALATADHTVYVGGQFNVVNEAERRNLAALDRDGTLLDWNPGVEGVVIALGFDAGLLYVGGQFNKVGDADRLDLAAIDADGLPTQWAPRANGAVRTLSIANGIIYVGGDFQSIDNVLHQHLAALDRDGVPQAWQPDISTGFVNAMTIAEGVVYVGGSFTSIKVTVPGEPPAQDMPRGSLAAITTDGHLVDWAPQAMSGNALGFVTALLAADHKIFIGGIFDEVTTAAGTQARNFLAAVGADGTVLPWNPNAEFRVDALAGSGSTIYAGGSFQSLRNSLRGGFAAISTDGTGELEP